MALHRVRDTTVEAPLANQKPRPVGGPDEAFMSGSPLRHPDNSLRLDVLHRLDDIVCQFLARGMVPRKRRLHAEFFGTLGERAEPAFASNRALGY